MPDVNWETFRALPGSDNDNFEMLCRALVIRNYAQFGRFAARAAQPGIEFHVNVNRACSLGEVGRWWGWQCRWYDLPGGTRIGTARRRKIVEAIRKTQGILPEMTDWVLWTRHALTAGDQEWFYGLDTPMELRLWTGAEVESHLCGEAEVLRKTYFGELILTPPLMSDLHSGAVASIRNRWMPEVHRPVDAERSIRAMLGELGSWREIVELAERIALASDYLVSVGDVPDGFEDQVEDLATRLSDTEGLLRLVHSQLEQGDLEQLFDLVGSRPTYPAYGLRLLARRMRGTGDLLALQVANAVADIVIANGLLVDLVEALGTRIQHISATRQSLDSWGQLV